LCVAECPVNAIYPEDEVPEGQHHFIELNKVLSQKWPNITAPKEPPKDAAYWNGISNKISLLVME
jgi:ferredoxin